MILTGYLAPVDHEHELRDELAAAGVRSIIRPHGRLVVSEDAPFESAWAANIWHDAERIPITSIARAANELRDRQRNWPMYAPVHSGRAELIAERPPHVSAKPRAFPPGDRANRSGVRWTRGPIGTDSKNPA